MSDSVITGSVTSGSQQQWLSRNVEQGSWVGGVWNMVQVGGKGAPDAHCGDTGGTPQTIIDASPLIAEKPYIHYDSGKFYLQIPPVEMNKVGASEWGTNDVSIDFGEVYVTNPSDSASDVNDKLRNGIKYVVITPGIYNWTQSVYVNATGSVILYWVCRH